jgi:hypothetical protein
VTVTYELPRLNRIGSLHIALTWTHEAGQDADVGTFQALRDNPGCISS